MLGVATSPGGTCTIFIMTLKKTRAADERVVEEARVLAEARVVEEARLVDFGR